MADNTENNHADAFNITDEDGANSNLTDAQRLELRRRRAAALAVDDADASHEGGMGAQGGAADFGHPKNFGLPK